MGIEDLIHYYALIEYPQFSWRVSFNKLTKMLEIGCMHKNDDKEVLNTYDASFDWYDEPEEWYDDEHTGWYRMAEAIRFAVFETATDARKDYEHRRKQNTETTR